MCGAANSAFVALGQTPTHWDAFPWLNITWRDSCAAATASENVSCGLSIWGCTWCGSFCVAGSSPQVACPACEALAGADACALSPVGCAWCGYACARAGACPACPAIVDGADCAASLGGCVWCGYACIAGVSTSYCPACGTINESKACAASYDGCTWCSGRGCGLSNCPGTGAFDVQPFFIGVVSGGFALLLTIATVACICCRRFIRNRETHPTYRSVNLNADVGANGRDTEA